jgi:hypothetical protein
MHSDLLKPLNITLTSSVGSGTTGAGSWALVSLYKGQKTFHFYNPASLTVSFSGQIAVQVSNILSNWVNVGSMEGSGMFVSTDQYIYTRINVESLMNGSVGCALAAWP